MKRKLAQRKKSIEDLDKFVGDVITPVPESSDAKPDTDVHAKPTIPSEDDVKASQPKRQPPKAKKTKEETEKPASVSGAFAGQQVILTFPRGASKFETKSVRISKEVRAIVESRQLGMSESQVMEQLMRLGLVKLKEIIDEQGGFAATDLIEIPKIFQRLINDKEEE